MSDRKRQEKFEAQMHDQTELPGELIHLEDLHFISHRYNRSLELVSNKDVLEIGAGSTIAKKEISQLSKSYIGLDIAQQNIDRCLSLEDKYNVSFVKGDAHNTKFDNDSFDLIIALAMIYYLDLDHFLKEASRILRPNGILFFCTSNKCVQGFVSSPYIKSYYTIPELNHALKNYGFKAKFEGAFKQKKLIRQTILIFLRNILKFCLNLIGLDRYWLIIRDKLKGEKVLIPEELSDFPNYESPLSPINPESEDRIHRIIYCVSQLKDSK